MTTTTNPNTQTNYNYFFSTAQYAAELAAGYIGSGTLQAYAPQIAYNILQPQVGSITAYYAVGAMVGAGTLNFTAPLGAAAGVLTVRYGGKVLKYIFNKGGEYLSSTMKKTEDKTIKISLNQLDSASRLLEAYAIMRADEVKKQAWDDLQLNLIKEKETSLEKNLKRRNSTIF